MVTVPLNQSLEFGGVWMLASACVLHQPSHCCTNLHTAAPTFHCSHLTTDRSCRENYQTEHSSRWCSSVKVGAAV